MALHHIAGDGWSFGVLMADFEMLYAAAKANPGLAPSELPVAAATAGLAPMELQYTDFAHWQHELVVMVAEPQLEYWKTTLGADGGPPPLELPRPSLPPLQTN